MAPAERALEHAYLPEVDPRRLGAAEIVKVLGPGRACGFSFGSEGQPVVAVQAGEETGGGEGVVKINGALVELTATPAAGDAGIDLVAGDLRLHVAPANAGPGERQTANLVLEVRQDLKVGYRGWYSCPPAENRQPAP